MNETTHKLQVVQNEGLVDRVFRFVIGAIMMAIGIGGLTMTPVLTWWEATLFVVAVYPLLTAILGWDPFYSMFGARSCSLEPGSKNACGSFPYEIDAAMGHNPQPPEDAEYDRNLEDARHATRPSR